MTVCESDFEVVTTSVQSLSHAAVPSFLMYCHLSSGGLPVTDAAMVSSPLFPAVAVGLDGLPGSVLKRGAVISLFASTQLLSEYSVKR